MEEVRDLKDVLERVEEKLVVVRYVHIAVAFVYWSTVLASFYILLSVVRRMDWLTGMAFWLSAVAVYYPVWSRTKRILGLNFRTFSYKILLPLAITVSICFWLPNYLVKFTSFERAIGVTILCSVSLYLLVVAIVVGARRGRFPTELIPPILSFIFVPAVLTVGDPITFAGFVIVTTYGITALTCLFKAINVVE